MIDREKIYSALWSIASNSAQFATSNRRLRHWADTSPAEQPALFMTEKGGLAKGGQQPGLPVVHTLRADFYIYVHSSDPYIAPATLLNPLIDSLEAALAPTPGFGVWMNLANAGVTHTYINGEIQTDEGVLGDQAVAIVPVEILAAG